MPVDTVVVRNPTNFRSQIDPDQIKRLASKYGFQPRNYSMQEQQNINYFQLWQLFLDTFTEVGRGASTFFKFFKGSKLVFDINICFSDRLGVDIFDINRCPVFILDMLDVLPPKNFDVLHDVMIKKDFSIAPMKTRLVLQQMFKFLSNWGRPT